MENMGKGIISEFSNILKIISYPNISRVLNDTVFLTKVPNSLTTYCIAYKS